MKLVVVLAVFVTVCAGNAIPDIPQVPGDNSHYVEGESRYIWMPDGNGEPHLVDLQEPADEAFLRTRNGANNQYWLFTSQNRQTAQVITFGNAASITASNYLASRALKVILHGWTGNGNLAYVHELRDTFLDTSDVNVIIVDWNQVAGANYITASLGVPGVGQFLGDFLDWLISTAGGSWDNVHLVGVSLGAHVIGHGGRRVGGRIARVTGLDPAGPGFTTSANRLSPTDGQHVEGIHTDGGLLGIMTPSGHADFYPNGGTNPQPGCFTSLCSHGRAIGLFDASVRFNHLVGRQCADITQAAANTCTGGNFNLGNSNINKRGSGLFGLSTASSWPF